MFTDQLHTCHIACMDVQLFHEACKTGEVLINVTTAFHSVYHVDNQRGLHEGTELRIHINDISQRLINYFKSQKSFNLTKLLLFSTKYH